MPKNLLDLRRSGLVLFSKGPNGGFYLDDARLKRNLADIVYAIDGDKLFAGCGLGLKSCLEKRPCPIHDEFVLVRKKIKIMLQSSTLGEF